MGIPFGYSIPVPGSENGSYLVELHFVEPEFHAPGARIFDVAVNGRIVRMNMDIFREAGYRKNTPVVVRAIADMSVAPPALRPKALAERYIDMKILPQEDIDQRRALAKLPPLIKGYLRLGGFVGDGAVIDHQFNTTDVSIVVKTDLVTEKYIKHYERQSKRDGEEDGL